MHEPAIPGVWRGGSGGAEIVAAQRRPGAAVWAAGAVPKITQQRFGEQVDLLSLMEVENNRGAPHYKQEYRGAWMAER